MKILLTALLLSLSSIAAQATTSMSCELNVWVAGEKSVTQAIEVQSSDDPHGSASAFNLKEHGGLSGFVTLLSNDGKEYVVINIYSDKVEVGSSSVTEITGSSLAHHQLILPGEGINSVVVDCNVRKK